MNEKRNTTIVIVTHNAALADSMPRVVTLRDGRVERDERRKASSYRDPSAAASTPGTTGKVDVG